MKLLVSPDASGVVSNAGRVLGTPIPAEAVIVDYDGDFTVPPMMSAIVKNGAIVLVPDWRGSGPWFDQTADRANREVPIAITAPGVVPPNDLGHPVTAGWEHMAMTPRAETSAEKTAREKAEAEARAAAEKARVQTIVVSDVQFAQAAAMAGIITEAEAVAWAGSGTLPAALDAAINALPEAARFGARMKAAGATTYERSSAIVAALGAAMGKTEADLDALFVTAEGL